MEIEYYFIITMKWNYIYTPSAYWFLSSDHP
jgi:hypothetical protein